MTGGADAPRDAGPERVRKIIHIDMLCRPYQRRSADRHITN